jgi:hypothetical protein
MGVAAIERATVVRSILQSCGAISPLRSAMPRATKANSPARNNKQNKKDGVYKRKQNVQKESYDIREFVGIR